MEFLDQEKIIRQALEAYPVTAVKTKFLGHSDKLVYRIEEEDGTAYVLGVYLSARGEEYDKAAGSALELANICSEMKLMELLGGSLLGTAKPVRNRLGELVSAISIDGDSKETYATLSTFIDGAPMDETAPDYLTHAFLAGKAAGELHAFLEGKDLHDLVFPQKRQVYLSMVMERLRSGVVKGIVTPQQMEILEEGGTYIHFCMDRMDKQPGGRGLAHTDLRVANYIMQKDRAVPVDFSRSVDGYPLYDLGEMCAHMGGPPVQEQILRGYHSVRKLSQFDLCCIEAMFVLFIASVVAEFITMGHSEEYVQNTLRDLTQKHIPGMLGQAMFAPEVRAVILG